MQRNSSTLHKSHFLNFGLLLWDRLDVFLLMAKFLGKTKSSFSQGEQDFKTSWKKSTHLGWSPH